MPIRLFPSKLYTWNILMYTVIAVLLQKKNMCEKLGSAVKANNKNSAVLFIECYIFL